MGSLRLKWVYGSTHRAQDVSNDAVDEYKSIVQQLYLEQNMTREEVLSHLKDVHGFSLSTNQFSKATKRWGFYKQPRQLPTRAQPPPSITEEEEASNPLNPLEELFDFEPDVLDTIDETKAYFGTGDEKITDSQILEDVRGQFSYTGRSFVSEPPPSLNHSQPLAMDVDFPCDALHYGTDKSLPESSKRQLQQLKAARKLETGPHSISSKMFARVPSDNHTNKKSHVDYLTCCYLFKEAVYRLERSGNSLDTQEHPVTRSNTDKLFARYRRDKGKLLASPSISLDTWSILCLLEPSHRGWPDDVLLDRLDINDLQFMDVVRECLGVCKKWIELVGKGMPRGAVQFDSLLLHQNATEALQNICLPLGAQSPVDTWQEAGYVFAFVWSNEQREAANSSSWLKEADISGLSPTYFLAIVCRMIVYIFAHGAENPWAIFKRDAESVCRAYLRTIEKFKLMDPSRAVKRLFIISLSDHHAGPDMDQGERRKLKSVQSYQKRAEDLVFEDERDTLTQNVPQTTTSHGDVRTTNVGSLASSRLTSSVSSISSYSHAHQQYLTLLSSNPAMTRSLASGSSRGSSLNSFRAFQAAGKAMATDLKEGQGVYI